MRFRLADFIGEQMTEEARKAAWLEILLNFSVMLLDTAPYVTIIGSGELDMSTLPELDARPRGQ
jgi:hypothetical protein